MDPLIGEFVKVGIVGVAAVLIGLQYLKVRKEKDDLVREHHKEITGLYEKHAAKVDEIQTEHRRELQIMADRHTEKAEKAKEKSEELTTRVASALDAIARQAERRRTDDHRR